MQSQNKHVPQFPHLLPALQTQMQMQLKSKCILSAGIFAFSRHVVEFPVKLEESVTRTGFQREANLF